MCKIAYYMLQTHMKRNTCALYAAATSIDFWRVSGRELAHPRHLDLLPAILWFYRLSCVSLNCLNAMWCASIHTTLVFGVLSSHENLDCLYICELCL